MKKIKLVTFLAGSFLCFIVGCKKQDSIPSLDSFNAIPDKQSYNIGDTIVFTLTQDADMIEFYSGKPGFNINYKNRNSGIGTNILQFQSEVLQASAKNNGDTIHLLISSNLKSYDSIGVANATWTDITNLATWPSVTSTNFVRSGSIDISQFNTSNTVYIAFQVLGSHRATMYQREWEIQGLTLTNTLADGTNTPLFAPPFTTGPNLGTDTLPYFQYAGWVEVNMNNFVKYDTTNINAYGAWNVGDYGFNSINGVNYTIGKPANSNWVTITNNYPLIFNPSKINNTPNNNGWVISSPVNLNLVRHDFPSAELKDGARSSSAVGLRYGGPSGTFATYTLPIDTTFVSGKTYDMAFVAQNHGANNDNQVVRHVNIKVN